MKYDFKSIEKKWQERWEKSDEFMASDDSDKPKHYNLVEFPYPSGAGLHVGHVMGYGASDAYCRMKRMQGYNVLFPIGWDSFGLPTENYAIKNKIHPRVATDQNIKTFIKQFKSLGISFDWSREIDTTDPNYYKWTQWIFLKFYKHAIVDGKLVEVADDDTITPRLAYQDEIAINWCPSCKIGLANEEVVNGKCERCGEETSKKMQKQWMLRITDYADRLIDDLDTVDYLERIRTQQINWIGRSEGTDVDFKLKGLDQIIKVFTTRVDTLFGCTYMVLSPEHTLVKKLDSSIKNANEVNKYIENAKNKSDLERTELQKEKTGVRLEGITAINPINNEEVEVWIADYVLANYGTGAVMAVPAHDDRDYEFAKKYGIEIKNVIIPKVVDKHDPPMEGVETIYRFSIQAIIINQKDGKVLTLKWKKLPWRTFITGGIDEGEDVVEGAKREILEETGYKNIKFIRNLGEIVESHFYANHKEENRKAHFQGILFELENDERDEVSSKEKEIHEAEWMTWEDLNNDKQIKCAEYDIWLDRINNDEHAFIEYGVLINSGKFDGLESKEAIQKITQKIKDNNSGDFAKNFKLRDWIFSRQHYWGEPIPIIHCNTCGTLPMDEKNLPLELPVVENYQPTDTGESPLAKIKEWVNVKCPKCGAEAKRETDTMPNWAGSSWYFLRYCDPKNNDEFISKTMLASWMPVDLYNGGMEHTTLHLLYSRFWHKFLYDLGAVNTAEPYKKRIAHGIILGTDNQKMSKSKGNVISPDDIVEQYGADTLRAYIMFIGPYDQESAWNMDGVAGVNRFLNKVVNNFEKVDGNHKDDDNTIKLINKTVKGVGEDIERYYLNTYIAKLMEFNNHLFTLDKISSLTLTTFAKLLSPACPHLASEMLERLKSEDNLWPEYDKLKIIDSEITLVVQINGKVRDKMTVPANISKDEMLKISKESKIVQKWTKNKEIIKEIVVLGKLVNIVIKG